MVSRSEEFQCICAVFGGFGEVKCVVLSSNARSIEVFKTTTVIFF